mmetsp:Transcript_19236/g.33184  ORF Transcript_19236/g.33184 Transcript_19236/m.33184 type:complete len:132 (-) Transcript_19236:446-841(-)
MGSKEQGGKHEQDKASYWDGLDHEAKSELEHVFGAEPTKKARSSTREEAFSRCAKDVVALTKCVDEAGPTWTFRCKEPFMALQICYDGARGGSQLELPDLPQIARGLKDSFDDKCEQWQWWWQDVTGSKPQ